MPPKWLLRWLGRVHVRVYRLSGGRLGGRINGLPVLLLTTQGRRTGKPHTTPVVFFSDSDRLILAPGFVETPDWYLNLRASPNAEICRGTHKSRATAIEADPAERSRLWPNVPEYWKAYRTKYNNDLPLLILTPIE